MTFILFQLSKKYGSIFTVYFGTNKVVVLAGYKTVKEALVGYAEEFGDRYIAPLSYDANKGHGMTLIYKTFNMFLQISTQTNTIHEHLKCKITNCICHLLKNLFW